MFDKYNRKITYLRISVTDRCNLRCRYCMPKYGTQLFKHEDILSYDEITEVVKTAVAFGIDKIRLTGGEPLVRKGIVKLVSMLAEIKGIKDLAMSSNGILLEDFAQSLADAGLHRINISLDTINPEKYKEKTRVGDISKVFNGINAAKAAGLIPIKINCVVMNSSDELDAKEVAKFCKGKDLEVRFIHKMDLETGNYSIVEGGDGGNCEKCNRLRLTANGMMKPCLFNDLGYNVRKLGAEEAIKKAVGNKPHCGTLNLSNKFYNIGG